MYFPFDIIYSHVILVACYFWFSVSVEVSRIPGRVLKMLLPSFDLGFSNSPVDFCTDFGVQNIAKPTSASKMHLL